ncbi:MAG: hypothetical protein IT452_10590 [Planctomycetia bacterium]|nr:hypothetical protein [Planctomycetia bacterium]
MPRVPGALIAFVALVSAGCGPSAGGASPESVFDRARTCSSTGDWAGFYDCVAPEKRDSLIGALLYLAGFTKMAGDAAEAEYLKVMAAHGLDPRPPVPDPSAPQGAQLAQWLAPAKDRRKLFADLMEYTKPTRKADDRTLDPAAVLSNVQVSGDSATGTLTRQDGGKKTVRFAKVDGRWFLDE